MARKWLSQPVVVLNSLNSVELMRARGMKSSNESCPTQMPFPLGGEIMQAIYPVYCNTISCWSVFISESFSCREHQSVHVYFGRFYSTPAIRASIDLLLPSASVSLFLVDQSIVQGVDGFLRHSIIVNAGGPLVLAAQGLVLRSYG